MDSNEPLEPALLEEALKRAADQRGPYLDRACAGDLQMRHRVQLLLRVRSRRHVHEGTGHSRAHNRTFPLAR
jgi:hypothetical protein